MIDALAALLGVSVMLALTILLPILSFVRASAARQAVARLEQRVAQLEAQSPGPATRAAPATRPPEPAAGTATGAAPRAAAPPAPAPATVAPPSPRPPGPAPVRLETRIGTRWMLYVGVATLVIGIGLFIRYAFASAWVTEPMRVGTGGLVGGLLIWSGRRFAAAGQARFGTTLAGGGIATWYLAVYASLNLYGLIGAGTGFTLLVAVTGFTALQADQLRSLPLAMVAVVGGFATPYLVGSDTDAQLALFSYTALLVGAIVYLAYRRDWPLLNLVSFLLTGLTVLVWSLRFYQPDVYLRTELFFTLYAGLFLWVLYLMRRSAQPVAAGVRLVLWTTPLWYHVASLIVLDAHWQARLVYLIALTGVGVAISVRWEAMWVRLALWAAVAAPLADWADSGPDGTWMTPAIVTWVAVASMHVAAQLELLRRLRARLHAADVLLIPANGLGLYFGLYAVLEPYQYGLTGLVAALVALAHGALIGVFRRVEPGAAMHVLVVAVTLAVTAVAVQLDGAWVTLLWATQAGGLVWLGLHERRTWIRGCGALLLGIAVLQLLSEQQAPVPAAYTVFLNRRAALGLAIVGIFGLIAWWHARTGPDEIKGRRASLATAIVGANVLLLMTLSFEIHAFWEVRLDTVRFASNAELVRQMMLSATWAAYAAALTAVGIKRRYAPVRYLAIAVFGITVLKVFTVDFSQLDSVYRIVSSMALGLLLVAASYLYQRQIEQLGEDADSDEPKRAEATNEPALEANDAVPPDPAAPPTDA